MSSRDGADGTHDQQRALHVLIPVCLAILLIAMIIVVATSFGGSDPASSSDVAPKRNLPVYWKVHTGDTYGSIAQKTGLTVEQLETFNPFTDPNAIVPGQRLKLRLKVPPPPPKRLGPKYWTVRSGQSYGSIAAATGHSIVKLQQLNPKLKATNLQPGDRLRLR